MAAFSVAGGIHETISIIVRGTYAVQGSNHGRTVYKKNEKDAGVDVFVYYWDERDGAEYSGWWFGPSVGADQVWAHNSAGGAAAAEPPTSGWRVPATGPVDPGMVVTPGAAAPAAASLAAAPAPELPEPATKEGKLAMLRLRSVAQKLQLATPERLEHLCKAAEEALAQELPKLSAAHKDAVRKDIAKQVGDARLRIGAQRQQAAQMAVKKAIQRIRLATPDKLDELKATLQRTLEEELPRCGELASQLRAEAAEHLAAGVAAAHRTQLTRSQRQQADNRRQVEEQQRLARASETAEEAAVPRILEIGMESIGYVVGHNGSTLKRLAVTTGCPVEVPQRYWQDGAGTVAVKLLGGAKQRRLAMLAINHLVTGLGLDDVAARGKGALVIPHSLGGALSEDQKEWLCWRLAPLQHELAVRADVSGSAVRLWPAEGASFAGGAANDGLKAVGEAVIALAHELHDQTVEAKTELVPDDSALGSALVAFMDQYGVLLRVYDAKDVYPAEDRWRHQRKGKGKGEEAPREEPKPISLTPVRVVGPAEATRDAAQILWARFVQGRQAAVVLQPPGCVQRMLEAKELPPEETIRAEDQKAKQMAEDFERDLRSLEKEFGVEVTQSETMLWVGGDDAGTVAEARGMLREMLSFYLPEDFLLREGLAAAAVEQLRQDVDLRVLTSRPECQVFLDAEEGTAWLCGGPRAEVLRRIDAVASPADAEAADAAEPAQPAAA